MIQNAYAPIEPDQEMIVPSFTDPDREDVKATRAGDMGAAERLYRRYSARVKHFASLMVGNERDAEDICQETFIRMLGSLHQFQGRATFLTWLMRIAINQSHNHISRNKRHKKNQPLHLMSEEATPLSRRSTAELKLAMKKALPLLSKGQQEVLIFHDVLGMKHHEIAEIMDCSVGTSKAQLHKARLRLRQLLIGEEL